MDFICCVLIYGYLFIWYVLFVVVVLYLLSFLMIVLSLVYYVFGWWFLVVLELGVLGLGVCVL